MAEWIWAEAQLCLRLTKEVDHKTISIAIDVSGRVRLKLDGDICSGGVELKAGLWSSILTQQFGCKVIPIIKGQQVILPDI